MATLSFKTFQLDNLLICAYSQNQILCKILVLNLATGDSESTGDLEVEGLNFKNLIFHRVNRSTFVVLNVGTLQTYRKKDNADGSFEIVKIG
jgi:hypothetical protein